MSERESVCVCVKGVRQRERERDLLYGAKVISNLLQSVVVHMFLWSVSMELLKILDQS